MSLSIRSKSFNNLKLEQKDSGYTVTSIVPNLNPADVKIIIDDNMLTVKTEKSDFSEKKGENSYYSYKSYNSFSESISLPTNIDTKNIRATYSEDGFLKIDIPKN